MSQWKQHLEETLGSEDASASALDAEAHKAIESILSEASASNETEALLQAIDVDFPIRGNKGTLHAGRAYLRGRSLLLLERQKEALDTLLPLCEKLEQQANWANLAGIANEILGETSDIETARYLAKAAEEGGAEIAPRGSLQRAQELFPDEHRICWLVAEEYEEQGEEERALALYTGCLPSLIEGRELEKIEEVFIRLEEQTDPETVSLLLQSCVRLAALKEWKTAETYIEPLLPRVKSAGLARLAWDHFLKLLPKAPSESNLRRFLRDLAPDALPDVDGMVDLLARSGILDAEAKVDPALRKLKELLEFAPGYRVSHQGWGAGKIRVNEGNALIIDFPDRPGHRMSISLARNALQVIPADDLRVLWVEDPDKVREMARTKPADLAYLAIRELGGRSKAQVLRRRLTADIMSTSRWSTWWKDARTAMEADERFDVSESFRQTYAIRTPGTVEEADQILPPLDRRRGIRANLNLLRRLLDQHPQHQERAARIYTPVLVRWLRDSKTNPEAAMAICLLLHRWGRLEQEDLHRSLRAILASGVEATAFADDTDQNFLIDRALQLPDVERQAILFGLSSRYASVREKVIAKMQEDPTTSEQILTDLLSIPEDRAQTAMALVWMILDEGIEKPSFTPSPWYAAIALCRLIERTGRDILRSQAMRLFKPDSPLARALSQTPATEEVQSALEDNLGRWRESERFLFPILAFFEGIGLGTLAAVVRENRTAATNRFLRTPGEEGTYDGLFLTRPTFAQLERERDQLARELKTTVAQAIQRAREMGDLSENAEYDAAKEKQAKHIGRIGSINEMLSKATVIGRVEVPEGKIGPGSRVVVRRLDEGKDETRTFWLLGEGDSRFGQEVISCSAPIAQFLLGRSVGDETDLEVAGERLRVKILSTELSCPEEEPATG